MVCVQMCAIENSSIEMCREIKPQALRVPN